MSIKRRALFCVAGPGFAVALNLLLAAPGSLAAGEVFLRGDANADGTVSMSDGLMIRRFLFNGDRAPPCLDAADVEDNGNVDFIDSIKIYVHFFPNDPSAGWLSKIEEPYPEAGLDLTDDELGCASYEIEPPLKTDDVVRLGDVYVAPGQEVEIPIYLTNSVEVEAVLVVINYDPDVFTPGRRLNFEGSVYEPLLNDEGTVPRGGFSSLQSWPDLGIITVGIIGDIAYTGAEIPPGTEQLVAKIPGTVSSSVAPGTNSRLEPTGEESGPFDMRTELTHRAGARYGVLLPGTIAALLNVVPDVSIFVRGDSNGDRALDISDAVATLNYLFVDTEPLGCLDAADANDDGVLNITDPIRTLQALFLDGTSLPPPSERPGGDPTVDSLDCDWSKVQ